MGASEISMNSSGSLSLGCSAATRFVILGWIVLASSSCVVFSDKNRPGETDIRKPPPEMDQREVVVPDDPGGWWVALGVAPTLEFGPTFGVGQRRRTLQLGGELSLSAGSSEETGRFLGRFLGTLVLRSNPQLIVGWTPYSTHDVIAGRWYAEVASSLIVDEGIIARWSGGISLHPNTRHVGAQLTARFYEINYLRLNWEFGYSWSIMYGFTIPITFTYLRSF